MKEIDFDKVETLEDFRLVFKALKLMISVEHSMYPQVKHLIKE